MTSDWPLTLPHATINRILNRGATTLIQTAASTRRGDYQIQDALVVRRNQQHAQNGRRDLEQDPTILTIRIYSIRQLALIDLDYKTLRTAGYICQRDFYDEWLQRRRHILPDTPIRVCAFTPVETMRLLHARVHRGYTTNPNHAIPGEGEALTATDLEKLTKTAREKDEMRQTQAREQMPITDRLRDLQDRARHGDQQAKRHLFMIGKHVEQAERPRKDL